MSQSRLDELRIIDPVLTTIIHGYSNESFVYEALFPSVSVSKIKGKIPSFSKEAFVVRDSNRAIRSLSNRIPPSDFTMIDFKTQEKDIEIALDYLEEEETPGFLRLEQKIAKQLSDNMELGKEKEAADIAQNPDNYLVDMVQDLAVGDAFSDYTSTTDPIIVIKEAISSVRQKIGRYPNTILMGDSTYQTLLNHPKFLSRISSTGNVGINKQFFKELFDIPKIVVGSAVYSNDGTSFADVWADNLIVAYVDANEKKHRNEYNPSFGYTFQREGKPELDTYTENGGKMKIIRITDNYCVQITSKDAAFLIKNTNQ